MANATYLFARFIACDIEALALTSSPFRSCLTACSLSRVIFLKIYSQVFASCTCLIFTIRWNTTSSLDWLRASHCSVVCRSKAIGSRIRSESNDPMKLSHSLRSFNSIMPRVSSSLVDLLTAILFYHVWRSWRLITSGYSSSQRISFDKPPVATVSTSNNCSSGNWLCTLTTCPCISPAADKASPSLCIRCFDAINIQGKIRLQHVPYQEWSGDDTYMLIVVMISFGMLQCRIRCLSCRFHARLAVEEKPTNITLFRSRRLLHHRSWSLALSLNNQRNTDERERERDWCYLTRSRFVSIVSSCFPIEQLEKRDW